MEAAKMKSACIALIFMFFLFSCGKKETTEPAPTTGTISGTVMNKAGDAVVSAAIITTEPPTSSVSSNADGKYTIEDVDPSDYIVQALKDGYDPGNVNVTVKAGKTAIADIRLGILLANHPPTKPQLVSPENNSEYQSIDLTLQWKEAADQDGDAVVYDLNFGKENPPPLNKENMDSSSLKMSDLDTAAVYYWQVVAKDSKGAKTASDIWQFKTTPNPIPTDGLVAYYPFNGNANDESGNGNDGTVYGATLTEDRFGNPNSAYSFDGVDDYIDIGKNVKPNFPVTISAWIKIRSLLERNVIFRNDKVDDAGYRYGFKIEIGSDGSFSTSFYSGYALSSTRRGKVTDSSIVNMDKWQHLVSVLLGPDNIKLFIDGENAQDHFHGTGTKVLYSDNDGMIGMIDSRGRHVFSGSIDDIRVYNRALTEDEIKYIYHEKGWEK